METEVGLSISALPIRYLGLPLTTKTMSRLDYEPLVHKIRSRFLSWTSTHLSFTQLINSVISSITGPVWSISELDNTLFGSHKVCPVSLLLLGLRSLTVSRQGLELVVGDILKLVWCVVNPMKHAIIYSWLVLTRTPFGWTLVVIFLGLKLIPIRTSPWTNLRVNRMVQSPSYISV